MSLSGTSEMEIERSGKEKKRVSDRPCNGEDRVELAAKVMKYSSLT